MLIMLLYCPMKRRIVSMLKAAVNLIYPLFCSECGEKMLTNRGLCEACISRIEINAFGPAACKYDDLVKRAIHRFKYGAAFSFLAPFKELITRFLDNTINLSEIDAIVPIPLHPVKARERGFNQARLLGVAVAKEYGVPVIDRSLVKVRRTRPQSNLNQADRTKNLKGAFGVRHPEDIKGKNILLIDDVYTTGATMDMAAKVLMKAGAAKVRPVALAKGA